MRFSLLSIMLWSNSILPAHSISKAILSITRAKNILPTAILNIAGAKIANPGLCILTNGPVLASIAITQSIMTSSMIINDICDLPVDRINSPSRPLVKGDISVKSAISVAAVLLAGAEVMNRLYIPSQLRHITHLSGLMALLYTPVLKRILFVKNISCATLVSCALLFSGSVANPDLIMGPNFIHLYIATRTIFLGSLCSEILMDIRDRDGDKISGIQTLAVVFGKESAWSIAYSIMALNMISGSIDLAMLHGIVLWGFGFMAIVYPALNRLRDIRNRGYIKKAIVEYGNKLMGPMVFMLMYLVSASKFVNVL
jgi:geranylgeranylglycerol-phosphate geranylgeranyltransferase